MRGKLARVSSLEEEKLRIDALIQQGVTRVKELSALVDAGLLTKREWKQQVIVLWTQTTEQVSAICEQSLDPYGVLATIMQSGATKAKPQQIRQLNGIRGLLASPTGEIIPFPVLGNYYIGLAIWEIFIAASGARKGFMDRSLNSALSGYLTRKLREGRISPLANAPERFEKLGDIFAPVLAGGQRMEDAVVAILEVREIGGDARQELPSHLRLLRLVALVVAPEDLVGLGIDDHHLHGRRADVDADHVLGRIAHAEFPLPKREVAWTDTSV